VGFPPGGSTDVLARLLAADAGKRLGHDILVVNRPGVTGALAVGEVVASPADGYTLGVTPSTGTLTELITRAVFVQEKLDVNVVPFQGDALDQYLLKDCPGLMALAARLGVGKQ